MSQLPKQGSDDKDVVAQQPENGDQVEDVDPLDATVENIKKYAEVFEKAATYLKRRSPAQFEQIKPYIEFAHKTALKSGISKASGFNFGTGNPNQNDAIPDEEETVEESSELEENENDI